MSTKSLKKTLVLVVTLSVAFCTVATKKQLIGNDILLKNMEVLMASEAYHLDKCIMPYFGGDKVYGQKICNQFTNEYLLYSCEVKDGYVSKWESKCVID